MKGPLKKVLEPLNFHHLEIPCGPFALTSEVDGSGGPPLDRLIDPKDFNRILVMNNAHNE